jgi:signal transduction histidine kinase
LESYCEDVSKQSRIKVRFRHRNVPDHMREGVAVCLYRVAQECLRNVVKHSRAARASVQLIGKDNEITLTVTDTGAGFEQAEARNKGGLGLVSMEERVRILAGTLSIRAKPGDGTRVMIRIPLTAAAQ